MDERLKRLLEELEAVLKDSLSESKQTGEVIAKIRTGNYDVFLVLDPIGKQEEEQLRQGALRKGTVKSGFTPHDIKFLKAMHISTDK